MRKVTVPLAFAATAALITVALMSLGSSAVSYYAQVRPVSSYAEDRAAIETCRRDISSHSTSTILISTSRRSIIRNAKASSTGSGTTRTNWSRSTASGCSQSGQFSTKGVMSGRTRAARIPAGSSQFWRRTPRLRQSVTPVTEWLRPPAFPRIED
jgi:hypothetical protein